MLIRLNYASQYLSGEQDLLEDLRAILVKARTVNVAQGVCGVLYYAHGHFFQCLEGEEQQVISIYEGIRTDSRHQILKCFEIENIETASFAQWSMKYAKTSSMLQSFLNKKGIQSFQPQNLQQQDLPEFIHLLLKADSLSMKKARNGTARGYQHYF